MEGIDLFVLVTSSVIMNRTPQVSAKAHCARTATSETIHDYV
jgi:hypothetical protein